MPTSFGGNSSPALFQLPHSHPPPAPQVGGWRLLRTLPSLLASPPPASHHTPTPRRGHATGRSLEPGAPRTQPLSPPRSRPGRVWGSGGATRWPGTPDRGRWKLQKRAASRARSVSAGSRGERSDPPGHSRALCKEAPETLSWLRVSSTFGKRGRGKSGFLTPALPCRLSQPRNKKETRSLCHPPEERGGFFLFLKVMPNPSGWEFGWKIPLEGSVGLHDHLMAPAL